MLEHWSEGMRRGLAARDTLGEERFIDVAQHELEADSLGTVKRVYDFGHLMLGDEVRAVMVQWARANQPGSRGAHLYTAEEYALAPAEINEAFAPYLERFGALCGRDQ